jgi:hypothetical protein
VPGRSGPLAVLATDLVVRQISNKHSRGTSVVDVEQSAEPLAALDGFVAVGRLGTRRQQTAAESWRSRSAW